MTDSEHTPPTGECHPACVLLPEMTDTEFHELVADIKEHGQRHPILIDEAGLILDGRHRWRALKEAGVEPKIQTVHLSEEGKVQLVVSENIHRRHLTVQQRAAVAAELASRLGEAAKARQIAGRAAPEGEKGRSTEQAAKLVGGVSRASVERAQRRMRTDPAAHEKAKAGKLQRKQPKPRPKTQPAPFVELPEDRQRQAAANFVDAGEGDGKVYAVSGDLISRRPDPAALDHQSAIRWLRGTPAEVVGTLMRLNLDPDRLRDIWRAVTGAAAEEEQPKPQPKKGRTSFTNAEVEELRQWAATMDLERLTKHVAAVPGFKTQNPTGQIQAFIDGKAGSYHLRNALKTVRADLSAYSS